MNLRFDIKEGQVVDKAALWESVKSCFSTLQSDGRYIWPMPEKERHIRSIQQNKYYHGVICKLISDHTGYTSDEVHQILAEQFLSYEKDGRTFVQSTTKLKTTEFESYMEDCRRWASMELQVYIPLPNEKSNYYYEMKGRK
jgi:hypothetical protein